MTAKGRLRIYQDETQQAEDFLNEADKPFTGTFHKKPGPPLPVKIFSQELNQALDEKYNNGIYSTGRKVVERLLAYYVKPMADQAS